MTEKQADRLKQKIKRIKADLAADKRRWGGFYDDSRGLRYLPPQYYIQLGDFKGGLRYLNWFNKNFPDDIGLPDFLFESIIILYQANKIRKAEEKAFQTYCSNTYLFDKFLGKAISPIDKYEGSNLQKPEFLEHFNYSSEQANLLDFSQWLEDLMLSNKFKKASQKLIEIHSQLKNESKLEKRRELIEIANRLEEEY